MRLLVRLLDKMTPYVEFAAFAAVLLWVVAVGMLKSAFGNGDETT